MYLKYAFGDIACAMKTCGIILKVYFRPCPYNKVRTKLMTMRVKLAIGMNMDNAS